MISRRDGYERHAWKGEGGMIAAEAFFADVIGCPSTRILGAAENYAHGDLSFPSGTVECKRQPIDPDKYRRNFVEVFEETTSERHRGGFDGAAGLLNLTPSELAATRVFDFRTSPPGEGWLERPAHLSLSITSIAGSDFTVYVNPQRHLYLYESGDLLTMIASAMRQEGLQRGRGNSNEDTFAVMVPVARMRWRYSTEGWRYGGEGVEAQVLADVRARLG